MQGNGWILTFVSVITLPSEAEGFKEQGNAFYSRKDYSEAFNYYTKAIGEVIIQHSVTLEWTDKGICVAHWFLYSHIYLCPAVLMIMLRWGHIWSGYND